MEDRFRSDALVVPVHSSEGCSLALTSGIVRGDARELRHSREEWVAVPIYNHIPVVVTGNQVSGSREAVGGSCPGADAAPLATQLTAPRTTCARYPSGYYVSAILRAACGAFDLRGLGNVGGTPVADVVRPAGPAKPDGGKPDRGRTISDHVAGSLVLGPADNPLSIVASGAITSAGAGVDGIDGPSGGQWTIANDGAISSAGGIGIALAGSGTVVNGPTRGTAAIAGADAAVKIEQRPGSVTNSGSIAATSTGIDFRDGGSVINGPRGSVRGDRVGVFISGAEGAITNGGIIAGKERIGVDLAHGGSIANAAGASITGNVAGVFFAGGDASLTNAGRISATGAAGADIENGGNVTNGVGASIAGASFGIFTAGGAGAVTNAGTIEGHDKFGVDLTVGGSVINGEAASIASAGVAIGIYGGAGRVTNLGAVSGGTDAIRFSNGGNLLVAGPKAAFGGGVVGGTAAGNALELAGGTGTIDGLSDGAGSVTESGHTWSFSHFDTLRIDEGGVWTVRDGHALSAIVNAGTMVITGTLQVMTPLDADSPGLFQLQRGAELVLRSAPGGRAQIRFSGNGRLVLDEAGSSGADTERRSSPGPRLQNFSNSDTIVLGQFDPSKVALSFDPSSGVLQVSNATQVAAIAFQTSSLARGRFEAADGGAGATSITLKR